MATLLSLLVCLVARPHVCEVVTPDLVRAADGRAPSFFECLTVTGQEIARQWIEEHPAYTLQRIQCSVGTDAAKLRERVESPEA